MAVAGAQRREPRLQLTPNRVGQRHVVVVKNPLNTRHNRFVKMNNQGIREHTKLCRGGPKRTKSFLYCSRVENRAGPVGDYEAGADAD